MLNNKLNKIDESTFGWIIRQLIIKFTYRCKYNKVNYVHKQRRMREGEGENEKKVKEKNRMRERETERETEIDRLIEMSN